MNSEKYIGLRSSINDLSGGLADFPHPARAPRVIRQKELKKNYGGGVFSGRFPPAVATSHGRNPNRDVNKKNIRGEGECLGGSECGCLGGRRPRRSPPSMVGDPCRVPSSVYHSDPLHGRGLLLW